MDSTSAMVILTLALVIPEREVVECVRGFDVNKSGKELIDCAHQRKNDDLR